MRKYGVFQVSDKSYSRGHERPLRPTATSRRRGRRRRALIDGVPRAGFNTPSRKLEFYSPTLARVGLARARRPALRARATCTGAT